MNRTHAIFSLMLLIAAQVVPAAAKDEQGWNKLFNGANLDGWYTYLQDAGYDRDPTHIFSVHDGLLHIYANTADGAKAPFGWIATKKDYSDYRLRVEYRWGQKRFAPRHNVVRDSGILYHVSGKDLLLGVWPRSVECQIQENDVGDIFTVGTQVTSPTDPASKPKFAQYKPSKDGGVPLTLGTASTVARVIRNPLAEHEGWNTVEVIVRGDSGVHIVNGKTNNECSNIRGFRDLKSETPVSLSKGQIALQSEGAEVFYRTVEVRPLTAAERAAGVDRPTDVRAAAGTPLPQKLKPTEPLSAEASLEHLQVRSGFKVELVAAEPMVIDPVAIDWGPDGRLWVVEMADYPLGMDGKMKAGSRVRVLEDTNHDGKYDKSTLFLDGINFANGIAVWRDGVLVTAAPEIFFAADTNGDGRADSRETLYRGFVEGNPQLRVNGLQFGMDGWLYCANGWSGGQVRSSKTGKVLDIGGRDLRIHPDDGGMDTLSGVTEFGRNRDDWDNWFGCDNSNPLWHYVLEDRYTRRNPFAVPPDAKQQLMAPPNPKIYARSVAQKRYHTFEQSGRFTSACGAMIYRDELLFGRSRQAHAFVCEPVHNLVHHEVVTDEGVTFRSQRARDEQESEFLASDDPWFRPVFTRTGPDGALWVVDMYRYMIEHPEWLPPEGKAELAPYFRLGEDRGRIYRIYPYGKPVRSFRGVKQLKGAELAAALNDANGTRRDLVQQQIMWNKDVAAVSRLQQLLNAERPQVRSQALYTLSSLGALRNDDLLQALRDGDPRVVVSATRLCELNAGGDLSAAQVLAAITNAPDSQKQIDLGSLNNLHPKMLFQLACSLGQWKDAQVGRYLDTVAQAAKSNAFIDGAILSSINKENIEGALQAAVEIPPDEQMGKFAGRLWALAAAMQRDDLVVSAAPAMLTARDGSFASWQLRAAGQLLLALKRRGTSFEQLASQFPAGRKLAIAALSRAKLFARSTYGNEEARPELRVAAISLLGFDGPSGATAGDVSGLSGLLTPRTPLDVQLAAIAQLSHQEGPEIAAALLTGWRAQGPQTRNQLLRTLLTRPQWITVLLDKIEADAVASSDLDAAFRQQLAEHSQLAIRERARKVLALGQDSDRQKVLKDHQHVVRLAANFKHGEAVFQKKCSICHRLGNAGYEVGPNLASLTDKSPQALLTAILDPSRNVETRYKNYTAVNDDGQVFTGLLATETGNSITLLGQEGKQQNILRSELDELRSTGKSLMPDGLEKDLSDQDLADVIAYVAGYSAVATLSASR